MLTSALTRAGLGNQYRVMFSDLPGLRNIAQGLAWYLTDRMPLPINFDKSLLVKCLRRGHDQYKEALAGSPRERADAMAALIAGMFWDVAMLAEIEVQSGIHFWDPLEGQPLGEFAQRHGKPAFRLVEPEGDLFAPPSTLRMVIASRVISHQDMALVGCSLDAVAEHIAA
jgi:hypothetical protein